MTKSKIEFFSSRTEEMTKLVKESVNDFLGSFEITSGHQVIPSSLYRVTFIPAIKVNSKEALGFCEFDGYYYNLSFSEKLFSDSFSWDDLHEIIGHEVAHLINSRFNNSLHHDDKFREICSDLGIKSSQTVFEHIEQTDNVLNKVKKLLALSESDNGNEAQSALLKARELMREYGIKTHSGNDEKIYRVPLETYKSYTTEKQILTGIVKMISNVWILLSNSPKADYSIFGRTPEKVIYAHGTKTECEIAEYLYTYLKKELAKEYKTLKEKENLVGSAKPSFYNSVFRAMKARFGAQEQKQEWGLVNYSEENMKLAKAYIYKDSHFSTQKSGRTRNNLKASLGGTSTGNNLRIRNGLNNNSSKTILALN